MRVFVRTGIFPVLFILLLARPAHAQFPVRAWLSWQTIETEHFAFHYPRELEDWTRHLAAYAESIDSAVFGVVGYVPPRKVQIVVENPYDLANGMAFPFLDTPVINLWATPPSPREDIGEFRGWGETLLSHEFTHIAHLTRPSRNARRRFLLALLPIHIGPLPLDAPRWLIEGYATYSEGKVTGSGRPHGSWRPTFLRQWALEGTLPRYDQLNNFGGFEGGEFAYLAGSAFLEWLAQRRGDSSLVQLWRRMSARQVRTFDEAFAGVYGETPRALYGRFTTELTGEALDIERRSRAAFPSDTGAIVQRLSWLTGDPAISRDGKRVAIVLRSPSRPSRVVIWSTANEPDTLRAKRDSILLARDPLDVPARTIYPPPKRVLASLQAASGAPYDMPRFLADGRVLLSRETTRGDGTVRPDLYIWDPQHNAVRRVSHGSSLRNADPAPDGRTAVAERCVHGWCDIALVDLSTGRDSLIVRGDAETSCYRPRFSPDGKSIVMSCNEAGAWRLWVVAGNAKSVILSAASTNTYDAVWMNGTTILATSDAGGIPNLVTIDLTNGRTRTLTHVTGSAVAPERNPADSSVWFLSLYSRGYDLRRIRTPGTLDSLTIAAGATPSSAARVVPQERPPFAASVVTAPRPYGFGPRLRHWLPSGVVDADGAAGGIGFIDSDVIGRAEVLAKGLAGDRAQWRGAAIDGTWRGWRPVVRAELFAARHAPSESRSLPPQVNLDATLSGGLLGVEDVVQYDAWSGRLGLKAAASRLVQGNDAPTSRSMAIGEAGIGLLQRHIGWSTSQSLAASGTLVYSRDRTFDREVVALSLGESGFLALPGVVASAQYGRTSADAALYERMAIGGSAPALFDRALLTQRIGMPALPTAVAIGTSALTYKISVNTAPLSLYWWSGSAAPANTRFAVWNRVIGAEFTTAVPAMPAVGTPAARGSIGVGESLDAPLRHRLRAYLSLILNP
jgi:hypothetical protein